MSIDTQPQVWSFEADLQNLVQTLSDSTMSWLMIMMPVFLAPYLEYTHWKSQQQRQSDELAAQTNLELTLLEKNIKPGPQTSNFGRDFMCKTAASISLMDFPRMIQGRHVKPSTLFVTQCCLASSADKLLYGHVSQSTYLLLTACLIYDLVNFFSLPFIGYVPVILLALPYPRPPIPARYQAYVPLGTNIMLFCYMANDYLISKSPLRLNLFGEFEGFPIVVLVFCLAVRGAFKMLSLLWTEILSPSSQTGVTSQPFSDRLGTFTMKLRRISAESLAFTVHCLMHIFYVSFATCWAGIVTAMSYRILVFDNIKQNSNPSCNGLFLVGSFVCLYMRSALGSLPVYLQPTVDGSLDGYMMRIGSETEQAVLAIVRSSAAFTVIWLAITGWQKTSVLLNGAFNS